MWIAEKIVELNNASILLIHLTTSHPSSAHPFIRQPLQYTKQFHHFCFALFDFNFAIERIRSLPRTYCSNTNFIAKTFFSCLTHFYVGEGVGRFCNSLIANCRHVTKRAWRFCWTVDAFNHYFVGWPVSVRHIEHRVLARSARYARNSCVGEYVGPISKI